MSSFAKNSAKSSFIAHRGYSHKYPENTLLALEQAFKYGACFVECDVQLTKDGVPVLMHDADLRRASGIDLQVHELNYADLKNYFACYFDLFEDAFEDENIPSLEEFTVFMKQWPDRGTFVEIKRSSIRQFGMEFVLQKIMPILSVIKDQVTVISFNDDLISQLQSTHDFTTGWVVDQWSEEVLRKMSALNADYFFVDHECLPPGFSEFQQSDWLWALYEIDDPVLAYQFIQKGVQFIETNDIGSMLQFDKFSNSGCFE